MEAVCPEAGRDPGVVAPLPAQVDFDALYDEQADFVFRSLQRLGVHAADVDDALQDVFVVAHQRLGSFEGRSSHKTWLFGIALHIAQRRRRTERRRPAQPRGEPIDPDSVAAIGDEGGYDAAVQTERIALLHALLDELDDEKRAVFVLAELEEMTAPDIADALGIKLNTVYSRLRLARAAFDQAFARAESRGRSRSAR
jgi:RNA polymerase sigma-70 factor, ECF subfamily